MNELILKVQRGENLSIEEIQTVMREIMSGILSESDIEAFLSGLRRKGATIEEITGAARIMRQFVIPVKTKHEVILDTCGTGGDKKGTFNISTVSALAVAACGVAVAKHGNRSVSSRCGSADILEALGVNLNLDPDQLGQCLDDVGIAFLFAQRLHPAMKHVAPVRKRMGVETIFNILGPLTNPAKTTHQMMGVYDKGLVEPLAHVLKNLGLKKALVVHGHDGLDEVTTTGPTFMSEFNGKEVLSYSFSPKEYGMTMASLDDLKGGDLEANVRIAKDILEGKGGLKREAVLLNAACGLYIGDAVKTIVDGISMATACLDSGKANQKLFELKEFTHRGQ